MPELVAELTPLVKLWQQLLADHQPDHRGRCRACTEGGTGRAVTAWPCLLYRLAGHAAVAHHVAHYGATSAAFTRAPGNVPAARPHRPPRDIRLRRVDDDTDATATMLA